MLKNWTIKPALKYIPVIIAVGAALGVADNAIGFQDEMVPAIVLHIITSLFIGFPLIVIATNTGQIAQRQSENYRIIVLGLIFVFIGVVASEIELAIKALAFSDAPYRIFSGEGLYLFNAILSVILGFGTIHALSSVQTYEVQNEVVENEPALNTIPIKKGSSIHLLPVESLSLLEAADKYAYIYNTAGDKHLCDYSLAYLEGRLPSSFIRIHRSYIINTKQISHIQAFDKKRYLIEFNSNNVPAVKSSAGYQQVVRELIKI